MLNSGLKNSGSLNVKGYKKTVILKEKKEKGSIVLGFRVVSFILLILFVVYTTYAMSIAEQSLLSFGYQLISSPDTAQVFIDLYIMAFLALVWMYQDMKSRGKAFMYWVPYALVTLVFVSAGPLLYIVLRPNVITELERTNPNKEA